MTDEWGVLRGGCFVSRVELDQRSARAASALSSLGIGVGDKVAILLRNDHAYYEAAFAAAIVGATPVPVNWHEKPEDVNYVLKDSQAKILVAHADLLRPLLTLLPDDIAVRAVPTPLDIGDTYGVPEEARHVPDGVDDWASWIADFQPYADAPRGAPAAMLYTSGTTGKPKGVLRASVSPEVRSLSPYYKHVAELSGLVPGTRAIVTGPMYHGAPLAWALGWVRAGGFVVLQPRFDPEDLLRLIEKHRITHLLLVPIMFVRLLKLPEDVRNRYDLSSLKHVTHGAAPCPRHVKQAIIEWWGPVIYEQYGSAEIGLVTGSDSEQWLAHPGTVGKILTGVQIRIHDEDGSILPTGEIGEVYAKVTDQPDFTYQGRPEARAEVDREGFVTAGDVGYLDEDGFLYLCDRKKDMVISGGVNIYPAEIEECLLAMPGVRDVAVFGIPDEEYGEKLAAAVELDGSIDVTAGEVTEFVRDRLAAFKAPRMVEFVGEIPRIDSGKILKRKLRETYWADAGRTI